MGKDGHEVTHHHDHHHDEDTTELRHDKIIQPPNYSSHLPNDPLNFSKKHPLYNIDIDYKGPEFSEIDDKRLDYIQKYAGKVPNVEIYVPKNIPGTSLITQGWYPRLAIFLPTVDCGGPAPRWKETEFSMSILTTLIPDRSIHSSSVSSSTDGGDILLSPGTRCAMRTTMNSLVTSMTNSTLAILPQPKSGSGPDDSI